MKCCCCNGHGGILVALLTGTAILGTSVVVSGMYSPVDELSPVVYAALEDPISGEWEGVATGDDLPEDLYMTVTFEMDDDFSVTGVFSTFEGDAPFEGDFDPESNVLTGAVTIEDGAVWEMALELDEDELEGEATETNSGMTVTVLLERSEEE